MRPLSGLTWAGTVYFGGVILVGALLVPFSLAYFTPRPSTLLALLYLGFFTQLAALMPIRWRRGNQTVDTMPLVAASLLAPGFGPALLSWLCKYDGRWPSRQNPISRLLFNRAKSAIEFGLPSMVIATMPLPGLINVPVRTLCLAAGSLIVGYALTGKAIAEYERESFWRVLSANVGISSIRSVLILCVGGGALYMVLQVDGGYVMGLGLLGLLFAVRSNMGDAQRQHVERIQTLELMAQALDARDPMTELHSQRVSNLAAQLGQALGLSSLEVERMRVAGLLHDIGKIGVPDAVLKKPGGLDEHEWIAMRRHAEVGAEMIARHSALVPIAPWVRYHHERWNGSGYPAGLKADEIPLGARILAVADSFDTITGPRVYRRSSMTNDQAVEDISAGAGMLYDRNVVNALRGIFGAPQLSDPEKPPVTPEKLGSLGLLRSNPRVRWLGLGMAVSSLGDPLTVIAVTVSAYAVTKSGLGVAEAMVLRAAAMMVAGGLLGGAVDRFQRRPLVVAADLTQFLALAVTPFFLLVAPSTLFAIVVVLGAATALSQAGRDASITHLVRGPEIGSVNSLIATGTTAARTIGYPIAALIVWLASSTTPLYLIDAATFVIAGTLTLIAGPLGGGIRSRSVTGAFRSTFRLPAVRPALITAGVGAFMLSLTMPVVIVLAYQLTSNGARTYTLLEVIITVGMMSGALACARFSPGARTSVSVGLALMGCLSIAISASPYFVVTAALLFVASVGNQMYVIGNRTELQQLAPTDHVGGVMATRGVLVQTLAILGSGAGGLISTAVGGRLTYGLAGIGILSVAAAFGAYRRRRTEGGATRVDSDGGASTSVGVSPRVEVAESA